MSTSRFSHLSLAQLRSCGHRGRLYRARWPNRAWHSTKCGPVDGLGAPRQFANWGRKGGFRLHICRLYVRSKASVNGPSFGGCNLTRCLRFRGRHNWLNPRFRERLKRWRKGSDDHFGETPLREHGVAQVPRVFQHLTQL